MSPTFHWNGSTPRQAPDRTDQRAAPIPPAARLLAVPSRAGNRAVASLMRSVQRAPQDKPSKYDAHPAALGDCTAVMRKLYETVNPASLAVLRKFKTLAVGMAVEESHPEAGRLVWTASGNWNDPEVVTALSALNVTRWDFGGSRSARGAGGAPGDAEQRMLSDADAGGFVVKAIAVSRPLCGDCAEAVSAYSAEHGRVLVGVVVPPIGNATHTAKVAAALLDAIAKLRNSIDQLSGDHQAQWDLIYKPSATGFAGYWVNHLFNKDIPPTHIWNNAYGTALAAGTAAKGGDILGAIASLIRARRHYLQARQQYVGWKDGVEAAAASAQVAIGVVAVAAVAAFVAPTVVASAVETLGAGTAVGATAAETGSAAAAEQMAVRIAAVIAEADSTMAAAEAIAAAEEATAEAEFLAELAKWGL